jgi:16S rRNA (cytidine1402-2'-O)-methyltransferase
VVAREHTTNYEEVPADTLSELCAWVAKMAAPKGEFVVLFHGAYREAAKSVQHDQEVRRLLGVLLEELPAARAVAVAVKLTNYKRNYLYGMAMAMKNGQESS